MWVIDHAAQEIVWSDEDLYATDLGFEHEDEGWWDDLGWMDEVDFFDGAFID